MGSILLFNNQEIAMSIWIGKEGRVYCVLSVSDQKVEVSEAAESENTLGFLLEEGEYYPVEYHSGEWVPAKKEVVRKFYKQQNAEWLNFGIPMPFILHIEFHVMIERAIA